MALRNFLVLMLACGAAGCDPTVLSPTALTPTEPLTIDWVRPVGWAGFPVLIEGIGFTAETTVVIGNAPAQKVEFRGDRMTVTGPVLEAGTVDVVLTNPHGERAVLAGGYTNLVVTLTPDRTDLSAGDQVTVTWSASPKAFPWDWVGLFEVGSPLMPNHDWGFEWESTKGTSSGTWRIRTQAYPPGQYEFRYAVGDMLTGWAAHSVPVTIR